MVPLYFVLIRCLNLGIPYLKNNNGKEGQFKGNRNEGSENYTEYIEDVRVGKKETLGRYENSL